MSKRKIRYYRTTADDFTQSAEQDFSLPSDYEWVRTDLRSRIRSVISYTAALVFGSIYCRAVLHMRIFGREKLRAQEGGFFLYGNHTQLIGDVVMPALCAFPKRIYTVASPANYGIPVIGKILPYLGALPTVPSVSGIRELSRAMSLRLEQGHPIVIYPEAHVWEYYTDIRPFPDTSFKFPVKWEKPSYCMTVTYRKSRIFHRPRMNVYIDGPFYPEGNTPKEQTRSLHRAISETMQSRTRLSDSNYILYRPLAEDASKSSSSVPNR